MALTKDQEEHSQNLDSGDYDTIWDNLSNFWDNMPGKEYVTIAWKAWNSLVASAKSYIRRKGLDHFIFSESYSKRDVYAVPIELAFPADSETHSFYVGSEFADILVLTDYINSPEAILRASSGDFTFARGSLENDLGTITFPSENYYNRMWVTQYRLKKINEIVDRFGVFVDFDRKTKYETKTIEEIIGLMMAQQLGPTLPRLEAGVNIINEWPYSPTGGTVSSVNDARVVVLKDAGGSSFIYNNTDLDFQHREDGDGDVVDIAEDATIIEYSPVTRAVRFDDIITMPDMHTRFPISYYEKWHTFIVRFDGDLPHDATTADSYEIDWDWSERFVERNKPVGAKPYYMIYINARPTSGCSATSYDNFNNIAPTCGVITSWPGFLKALPVAGMITNYNIGLGKPIGGIETTYGGIIDEIPIAALFLTTYGSSFIFMAIANIETTYPKPEYYYMYITNANDATLSPIYCPNFTTQTAISADHSLPYYVCSSPLGDMVYVSCDGSASNGQITVIDPEDDSIVATMSGGDIRDPRGICTDIDGDYIYVVSNNNEILLRFNIATYVEEAWSVGLGNNPTDLCVSPYNGYLYVTNKDDDTVSVVDPVAESVSKTIMVGSMPKGACSSIAGDYVYIACYVDKEIKVIQTSDDTIAETIDLGTSRPNDICAFGDYLYTANGNDDTVTVISADDHSVIESVGVGDTPIQILAGPTGRYIYVTNSGDDTVSVIDTNGNYVVDTLSVGDDPRGICWVNKEA